VFAFPQFVRPSGNPPFYRSSLSDFVSRPFSGDLNFPLCTCLAPFFPCRRMLCGFFLLPPLLILPYASLLPSFMVLAVFALLPLVMSARRLLGRFFVKVIYLLRFRLFLTVLNAASFFSYLRCSLFSKYSRVFSLPGCGFCSWFRVVGCVKRLAKRFFRHHLLGSGVRTRLLSGSPRLVPVWR